jgi:hypothetical protein
MTVMNVVSSSSPYPSGGGAAGAFPAPHHATRGRDLDAREEDARRDRERRPTESHPLRAARARRSGSMRFSEKHTDAGDKRAERKWVNVS